MYTVFQRDGFDYFSDMMPALHNYVTVDTKAFLSTPDFMMCMYNMAKTMLEGDPGEDPECHAAKLLEVISHIISVPDVCYGRPHPGDHPAVQGNEH